MSETNNPSGPKAPIFPLKLWFISELIICTWFKSGMGFLLVLFEYANSLFNFKKCYNRLVQDMFEQFATKLNVWLLTNSIPVVGTVIAGIVHFVGVCMILLNQAVLKAEELGYLSQRRGWIQLSRYGLLTYHVYSFVSWTWPWK